MYLRKPHYVVTLGLVVLFLLCCLTPSPTNEKEPKQERQYGSFILGGGGTLPQEVYDRFFELAGGPNAPVVVLPGASPNPEKYRRLWPQSNVTILHPTKPGEASNPDFSSILESQKGVWMPGGDQRRLSDLYRQTPLLSQLKKLLARGGVVGGTSAGASVMSQVMIYGNSAAEGFGLLSIIIDQHFTQRNRLPRLKSLIELHPALEGVGIDEDTALVISNGMGEVIGNRKVFFFQKGVLRSYSSGQRFVIK